MKHIAGDCFASIAMRSCFVNTFLDLGMPICVSLLRFRFFGRLLSLRWLPYGSVRHLRRYCGAALTPVTCPLAFRFLHASVPATRRLFFVALGQARPPKDSWSCSSVSPPVDIAGHNRFSRVPVEPHYMCAVFSDPSEPRVPCHSSTRASSTQLSNRGTLTI